MTGVLDTPIEVQPDGKVLRVPEGPTESTASVKVRRGQCYFRQVVINGHEGCFAVSVSLVPPPHMTLHLTPPPTESSPRYPYRHRRS